MKASPIRAVFFDIGGTLGSVALTGGTPKLTPYATSEALIRVTSNTLGLKAGIISNIPDDLTTDDVRKMLDVAGLLAALDGNAIITNHDAGVSKPDRKIFAYAAKRIGILPNQCLYVGEDPAEVAGAQEAGMAGLIKPSPA